MSTGKRPVYIETHQRPIAFHEYNRPRNNEPESKALAGISLVDDPNKYDGTNKNDSIAQKGDNTSCQGPG